MQEGDIILPSVLLLPPLPSSLSSSDVNNINLVRLPEILKVGSILFKMEKYSFPLFCTCGNLSNVNHNIGSLIKTQ